MNPLTLRLGVMMFLEFFVWGGWFVSVAKYLQQEGLGAIGGDVYSTPPIAAIVSPLFLGLLADRVLPAQIVLGLLHLAGGALLCAVPLVPSEWLFWTLLGHTLCYMPTLGLTNTIAFGAISDAEGDSEKQFPIIRVFGTVGWIVAGLVVSWLDVERTAGQFFAAGGVAMLLGFYSFSLPHTPPSLKGSPVSVGKLLGADAWALLKDRSFATFMIASLLICIPLAFYYQCANLYLDRMLLTNTTGKMTFGQMSEIGFMLLMPLFFRRLGVKWMLLVGMSSWVVRYALFALAAPDQVVWMMIFGVVLHGICYDFFFVTGQIYVDQRSPKSLSGQTQGLLVLATQGVGMLIGAQLAGRTQTYFETKQTRYLETSGDALVEVTAADFTSGSETVVEVAAVAWDQFWWVPAAAAGVVAVLFAVLFRDRSVEEKIPETTAELEQA